MSYIPKKALKQIRKVRGIVARSEKTRQPLPEPPPCFKLDIATDPKAKCRLYDVYYNGKKQSLCVVADSSKGYIKRYIRGIANIGQGGDTEVLFGKVEIVPKGKLPLPVLEKV